MNPLVPTSLVGLRMVLGAAYNSGKSRVLTLWPLRSREDDTSSRSVLLNGRDSTLAEIRDRGQTVMSLRKLTYPEFIDGFDSSAGGRVTVGVPVRVRDPLTLTVRSEVVSGGSSTTGVSSSHPASIV